MICCDIAVYAQLSAWYFPDIHDIGRVWLSINILE